MDTAQREFRTNSKNAKAGIARVVKPKRSRSAAKAASYTEYAELLTSIFEFMLMSGASEESILETTRQAVASAARSHGEVPSNRHAGLAMAALVLDAWHRNRRYLDSHAKPKPIPLVGAAPSVEALIRAERPRTDAAEIARHFRSLRLIVRRGKNLYRPADRMAVISRLNPLVQQHVARSSSNLLRTIRNNVTRPHVSRRLIERFAEVPDLPSKFRQEFYRFTQTQGWAFLKNVNDWLEMRRARRTYKRPTRTLKAGVHLYAYIDAANGLAKARR